MWLPGADSASSRPPGSHEELTPPFPIPQALQPASELKYQERGDPSSGPNANPYPSDPFANQVDPFATGTPTWHDPAALYDTPRHSAARSAVPASEPHSDIVQANPVPAARQRRKSDPCVGDSPVNVDSGVPTYEEVTLKSVPTNARSAEKLTHAKAAVDFASWEGNSEGNSLSLFPSVDEIEKEILKKHQEKAESGRSSPMVHTGTHTPPVAEAKQEMSLSNVFDDPKYFSQRHIDAVVDRMRVESPEPDSTSPDEFASGYDIPLELIQKLRLERTEGEKTTAPGSSPLPPTAPPSSQPRTSPAPPPLPERNPPPKMMQVVASPQPTQPGPPLPERNANSSNKQFQMHGAHTPQARPPVAAPRVTRLQEPELPPLPPRNVKARSTSPQPPSHVDSTVHPSPKQLPSGSQAWRVEMLRQGYSEQVVQRALAVAGEDLQLAERILKAFGSGTLP